MALDVPVGLAVKSATAAQQDHSSYVDWPAIIAGIVLASAISLILLAFGSAVGLSFADFRSREGASAIWVAVAAASWLIWVLLSSLMAGGYLTGRLRHRFNDSTEHESDVRDGAHGLLVWAGSVLVGTIIATAGIGAAASAVGNVAATVTTAAASTAEGAIDPNAYFVDTLFRSATPATDSTAARAEAGRIFAQAALGDGAVTPEDRTYLASVVAANTGLTPDEANARVDQVSASIATAREQAVEAAETARRAGVIGAFLLAASLLASAAGAYWASSMGGRHRDEGTVFADVFRRY